MTNFAELASQVAKQFRRDEARKQRILARSPQLSYAVDAEELGRMSSKELALRELKELGITVGADDDPEKMLDMHHAGRAYVRDGGTVLGGCTTGSASDSADSNSIIYRYIRGET